MPTPLPNKILEEKLDDFSAIPVGHQFNATNVWQQLETALAAKKRKRPLYVYAIAAAILLFILSSVAYLAWPKSVFQAADVVLIRAKQSYIFVKKSMTASIPPTVQIPEVLLPQTHKQLSTVHYPAALSHANVITVATKKEEQVLHDMNTLKDTILMLSEALKPTVMPRITSDSLVKNNALVMVKKKMRIVHINELNDNNKDALAVSPIENSIQFHFNTIGNTKSSTERLTNYTIPLLGSKSF